MNSAIAEPVFSVPLNHFRCAGLVDAGVGSASHENDIPMGLGRFVGDQTNPLLRIFTPSKNQSTVDQSMWSGGHQWPLVFFGPSGTGKTSLALTFLANLDSPQPSSKSVHSVLTTDQTSPVFMTALDFDRRYRSAMETDSITDFRNGLIARRGILIDNLHELAGKSAAQHELLLLIDAMVAKNRPILFTMHDSPQRSNIFVAQLASRLTGGLTLPVAPPGPAARLEIIRELAEIHGLRFTHESIDWLVHLLPVTAPGINHFMLQFKTYLKSAQTFEYSADQVLEVNDLTRWLSPNETQQKSIANLIVKSVAQEFNLKVSELSCSSRKQTIVMARAVAIYLNRKLAQSSFKKIGQLFGNRDHSTIMHAYRKIEKTLAIVPDVNTSDDTLVIQRSIKKLQQKLAENITDTLGLLGKPVN